MRVNVRRWSEEGIFSSSYGEWRPLQALCGIGMENRFPGVRKKHRSDSWSQTGRFSLRHPAWTPLLCSVVPPSSLALGCTRCSLLATPTHHVPGTTAPQGSWHQDGIPAIPGFQPISLPHLNTPAPPIRLFLCLAS